MQSVRLFNLDLIISTKLVDKAKRIIIVRKNLDLIISTKLVDIYRNPC